MEERSFTIVSVFFTLTGSVPIITGITENYKKTLIDEIKSDMVYKYIMSDIPDSERIYDEDYPDYDPIVKQFILDNNPEFKQLLSKYERKDYVGCIIDNPSYISLKKMSIHEYNIISKYYKQRLKRKNKHKIEKINKQKYLKKEKSRIYRINQCG